MAKEKTILIVDDEAANIQLLLEILQIDYRILIATSGEQALNLCDKHHDIDLMLLDVDMPKMSGFNVLHQIKRSAQHDHLPIILVTARNSPTDEALGLEHGANDYISKPISSSVVKARIQTQLTLAHTQQTISNQNIKLKSALREAELAKNELSQITSMISHELRTPIAILRCEVELLADGIRKPDTVNLNSLLEEVVHFNDLIDDLFELVLSDTRTLKYDKAACQIDQLVKRSISLFESKFMGKKIELSMNETSLNTPLATQVFADPKRIKQVLDNILNNSLKYTDTNGHLQIHLENNNDWIWVHFQDSAPSVSEESLSKLFDQFYRVEKSRNRATGGAGLGLAICKTIMEDHEGSITAKLSPLGGLWVSIGLPVY
jgi:signal transduction histidine kinase